MARYIPTPDLWDMETYARIENGTLKLQPGQWVKCGSDQPSRLHEIQFRGGQINHIRAFHYPSATKRFMEYLAK